MAKSKKASQSKEFKAWTKWLAANPVGSPNNLNGITADEWLANFANGGKLPQYSGGGNFGSKIGDSFKFAGDTLLSAVGATDVIGDDAYRNHGFADASRVGEQIGSTAGQVVGSIFGAGQAVKMGQQAIGALDGTDEERARVEQLRANPEASGKYAQSIGQMNNAIMPLASGIGAAGQVGAGALKGSFQGSNLQENLQIGRLGDKAFRAYGGNLKPNGGDINIDESVVPGSPRHLELQAQQANFDKLNPQYLAQQEYFKSKGVTPSALSKEQFDTQYPGLGIGSDGVDLVPEGNTVYDFGRTDTAIPEAAQGLVPFTSGAGKNAGRQFLTGIAQPQAPIYDLAPDNDIDMEIYPEKEFENIKALTQSHGAGNVNFAPIGTKYGYSGQSGQIGDLDFLPPEGGSEAEFNPLPYSEFNPIRDATHGGAPDTYTGLTGENKTLVDDYYSDQISKQVAANNRSRQAGVSGFAYGGVMNQNQGDGKFIEYNGPSHAGGGIKVNEAGIPTNGPAAAEVEGGETDYDNGIENYIFSDRLVLNPGDKKKKTFADESKKINNKYKNSENDKIAEDSRKMELEALKGEQESLKQMMDSNQSQDQLACGGTMKHAYGGGLDPLTEQYYGAINQSLARLQPPANRPIDNISINEPLPNIYDDIDLSLTPEAKYNQVNTDNTFTPNQLPQDSINPAGYLASNIGNVSDLIQSAQPNAANDFGRMNPNLVNLDAQRKELEKQAGVSRAISRENARNAGGAGAAMTNQVIANALVNSNLGSGLSQSYMTEANTNAQIKNQAEQVNTQIGMQEEIANQQDKAMSDSVRSKALHSIGENTDVHLKDITSAEVGNLNNKMWFDLVSQGKYSKYLPNESGSFDRVIELNGKYYDPKTKEELNQDGTKKK